MTNPACPPLAAAPADLHPHAPWPLRGKIAAYAILAAVAVLSIWIINRRVDSLANGNSPSGNPAVQSPATR